MLELFILLNVISLSPSDTSTFVSPAQLIEQAKAFEEEDKYSDAIDLYLTISENDTSYIQVMSELMSAYNNIDEYEKTIKLGHVIKDLPSQFRNDIYISLGNAYLDGDNIETSIKIYKEGLTLFPYSHVLMYNLGLAYRKLDQYENAVAYFKKSAQINPFYSSNHMMLGYISMLQGHRTKSLLSYLTYLAINPDKNSILIFLENMVNNAIRPEGSIKAFEDNSQFEHYDNLLKSKAALDSRFTRNVDFNVSIVKHAELLFSKLQYEKNTDDFWMNYYVPFYTQLERNQLSPAFIYFILKSTNNEEVAAWIEKHDKEKTDWVNLANTSLKENRITIKTEILGKGDTYSGWYFNDNSLSAIGNQIDEETRTGPWLFYSINGQLNATGEYSASGLKIGVWEYYHDNGQLSRIEEFDDQGNYIKPAEYFYEDGAMSIIAYYNGIQLDSLVEYYYECGQIKERMPYDNGVQSGSGILYHLTGEKKVDYVLNEEELNQTYTYYFKNGQKSSEYIYENGILNGPFNSYYIDGQDNEIGIYKMDSLDGDWIGYHPNGEMSYKGSLNNGTRIGQWTYFHSNGNPSDEYIYDDGEYHGILKNYGRQGNLQEITQYNHGLYVGYTYFNLAGDTLSNAFDLDGNMDFESHYTTGELHAKSALSNGKTNGPYTSYFKNGKVYQKGTMKDGEYHGVYEEYYPTGDLYSTCNYTNGTLDGYYRSFFKNGQPELEGWYVDGEAEQLWKQYFPDGSKDQELYYISGDLNGWKKNFALGDKIHRAFKYDKGTLVGLRQYDTLGTVYHEADVKSGTGWRAMLTVAGDTTFKAHSQCGYFDKDIFNYYPNKQVESRNPMKNSLYEGKYEGFSVDGKLETIGNYMNNEKHGSWKWYYENGQLESDYEYIKGLTANQIKRYYYNGQLESNCQYEEGDNEGPCSYYDLTGNLQLTRIYVNDDMIGYLNNQTQDTINFQEKGEFILKATFPNGKTSVTQSYKDGLKEGPVIYFNANGTKSETIDYHSGETHGKWVRYYTNGNIHTEKNYSYDLKNGDEKAYYENGQIKSIIPYKNGEVDGTQIIYNQNGTIKSQTFYLNGYIY
ncbi:MAG: antitoxin component YwqK of YwqJK toxin-antitoxin module [Cyclobacteriaceae bacterium]|jgi:antitoxin component YwqK of YwqJK toxin-antitoxin module